MSEELETTETTEPKGKTFSEDYVRTLREEAKENRIARKTAEEQTKTLQETNTANLSKVKAFFGLKPEDELDDSKMESFKNSLITKADTKLILAEIKSLDGYDTKLVERLLDKSKLTISENGDVTGLKETVEALALEFPLIKIQSRSGGANPPLKEQKNAREEYEDAVKEAYENPRNTSLVRKVFLLKEKLKGE